MIERINQSSVNINNRQPSKQPQFTGAVDAVLGTLQLCEKVPMVNVAVLDLSTAIIPRTIVESETNPYAGFEAFRRRESSGLLINCIIPSFIVIGIAQAIQGRFMGKGSKMSNCWANEDTIKLVTKYWKDAQGTTDREKSADTIRKILQDTKGVDGNELKSFKGIDFEDNVKTLTDKVFEKSYTRKDKKALQSAYESIAKKTHITENIKIGDAKGFHSQNLESVIKSTPRILRELVGGKISNVEKFASKAGKLVNAKSLMGLGVILPLAVSAQPINRWITAKTSGKKGAPIYKDFADTQAKELSPKEKSDLLKQKFISIGSMIGVALLSMGGKFPTMKTLQFKNIFPTMDQARIIATATFASRMAASEDKNDLREATVRDIATFSSFYFLGDHVAKGIATLIEKRKPEIKLINVLEKPKEDANMLQKLLHWTKHTAIKSSDEVVGKTAIRMRSLCQLGNLAFSLVALGLIIPMMNRHTTNKKREQELKNRGIDQKTIDKYYPHFIMKDPNFASRSQTYKDFTTAK